MKDFRLPILGYHHVGPARAGLHPHLGVSAREFEQHLDWLLEFGYETVRIEDVTAAFDGVRPLPRRAVWLTFDDGYADLAATAFPAMRARRMTGTVFVVTRRVGEANIWDTRPGEPSVPLLTEHDIRHWHSQGIQFGAHTRTHAVLPGLSAEALTDEVIGSRDDLSQMLGAAVESFAYPYGRTDSASALLVSRTFRLGCSSWHGVNRSATPPWMLRRSMVSPGSTRFTMRCHLRFGRLPWESVRDSLSPEGVRRFLSQRRFRDTLTR